MSTVFKNVRISWPNLFKFATFEGQSLDKYDCKILFDKQDPEHMKQVEAIQAEIKNLIKTKLEGVKLKSDKICLRDGDEEGDDGKPIQPGYYTMKLSTKRRPLVVNRDKTPITEEDGVIYGGCRVNVAGSLWALTITGNKRIMAQLDAVQFVRDDEPMGAGAVSANVFDDIGDSSEDPFA